MAMGHSGINEITLMGDNIVHCKGSVHNSMDQSYDAMFWNIQEDVLLN